MGRPAPLRMQEGLIPLLCEVTLSLSLSERVVCKLMWDVGWCWDQLGEGYYSLLVLSLLQ